MADIFISYAHSDRDEIEALAAALEAHGYSVWWDRHSEAGSEFSADIERELDAARGVVVCWSQSANQSHWVKDEASAAAEQDRLIPVALDGERAPMGFRQYQALYLDGMDRASRDSAMAELIAAIDAKLSGEKIDHPQSGGVAAPARKTRYSLHGAIAGALIFVSAAFFALASRDAKDPASDDSLVDARPSIAVMAFENISANADQIYFSKGISEEIFNGLAQIDALRVSGRTSSFVLSRGDRDL